jgi:hypothetical protein
MFPGAAQPPPKADPIGHKDRKKGNALTSLVGAQSCCALIASEGAARLRPYGHDRPRAYRRDAGYSSYLEFLVFFVAIQISDGASPSTGNLTTDGTD